MLLAATKGLGNQGPNLLRFRLDPVEMRRVSVSLVHGRVLVDGGLPVACAFGGTANGVIERVGRRHVEERRKGCSNGVFVQWLSLACERRLYKISCAVYLKGNDGECKQCAVDDALRCRIRALVERRALVNICRTRILCRRAGNSHQGAIVDEREERAAWSRRQRHSAGEWLDVGG